jgi:ribonuclease P protein component
LRHVARTVLPELHPADRVVIRALPGSRQAVSPRLEKELRTALQRIRTRSGASS